MSDRLKELQHQRALVQEQLAWLDREISAAGGTPASDPTNGPAPIAAVRAATSLPSAAATAAAEAILAKYQNESADLPGKVKRGCFLYFLLAFALVGLGVLGLYLHTVRK